MIGAGSAGLHFIQLLKKRGFSEVIVADLASARLEKAKDLGADLTVLASEESVVEATMDRTRGLGADLVVEAAGHDVTRAQAMSMVRERGRIGLFGLPERPGEASYPFEELFRRQPTIEIAYGAQRERGLASFREAVDEIHKEKIAASGLVSHICSIEDISEALDLAHNRSHEAFKVCLSFEGSFRKGTEKVATSMSQ